MTEAFVSSGLHPRPTDEEFKALFTALESYHNEDLGLILWRSILSAPIKRAAASYRGIFPRLEDLKKRAAEEAKAQKDRKRQEMIRASAEIDPD